MISTSENTKVEIRSFPIRLQEQGQINVPKAVQDSLNLTEGDTLTLLQIGDLVLLTPKPPQVPQLADQIAALSEQANLSLAELLSGVEAEREAILHENQLNPV